MLESLDDRALASDCTHDAMDAAVDLWMSIHKSSYESSQLDLKGMLFFGAAGMEDA